MMNKTRNNAILYLVYLFLLIPFSNNLFAKYSDIPVTRNLYPEKYPVIGYQEYKIAHPSQTTISYEINRTLNDRRENRNFLIIVESSLYPLIETSLSIYQNDLLNEELNSFLISFEGTSVADMKAVILDYFNMEDIVGTVLIGDLPSAWFEMYEDFDNDGEPDGNLVEFPLDLYFSDLDGEWYDIEFTEGIYDYHAGSVQPDIFVGRIKADNLSHSNYSESELINNYFERNHLFRTGSYQSFNTALAYVDDAWASWGDEYEDALAYLYQEVELIDDINTTTAEDYRTNQLTADHELIQLHVHSGTTTHHFYQNNGTETEIFLNNELPGINPTSYFYNLFACSAARFETNNNFGSLYLLANDFCLGVVGSTKTGSMLDFSDFYRPLYFGIPIGEGFTQWWQQNVDTGHDTMWERSWFYGMIILGDPTLGVRNFNATFVGGDVSGTWSSEGNPYLVEDNISIPIDKYLTFSVIQVNPNHIYDTILQNMIYLATKFLREVLRRNNLLDSPFKNRIDIYKDAFDNPIFGGLSASQILSDIQYGNEIAIHPLLNIIFREITSSMDPKMQIYLFNSFTANVAAADYHHTKINEADYPQIINIFYENLQKYQSKIIRVISTNSISSAILQGISDDERIFIIPIKYRTQFKGEFYRISPPISVAQFSQIGLPHLLQMYLAGICGW